MFALIRMDFIACRLILAIGMVVYVLYAATAYESVLSLFVLNIAVTIALILVPIIIQDKYRIENLVAFLPPARYKVVAARYVVAVLALGVGLALQYGLGAVLSVWLQRSGFRTLCALETIFVFCFVPLAFVSLFLPCWFRFGLGRGAFFFLALSTAIVVIASGPLLATGWLSSKGGFVMTREMTQYPEQGLLAFIRHIAATGGAGWFWTGIISSQVLLFAGSLALSIWFFEQRDH
jgi:hypothetical protein